MKKFTLVIFSLISFLYNLFILANVGSQSILMKTDLNGDTLWVNHYNNSGFAQKLIEKNN